ncbi:hypothetical protein KFE80_10955 [bacterium SCSIO 12696]|nr:hypothetical protein KFE80_10955 [bacterium SCSIO 12696]
MRLKQLNAGVLLAASLIVSSCGGGGGGDQPTPENRAPVVSSANTDQVATVGSAFSYDATRGGTVFRDADGDRLTYSVGFSPSSNGLAASAGAISGTPQNEETTMVTITANDGNGGVVSDTFAVAASSPASPVNRAPQLSSPNSDQVAIVGQSFSYDATQGGATFVDADGDALTYTVVFSPSDNGFAHNAGQVSGIPQGVATTTVTITADDGNGGVASDTFAITSSAVPPPSNRAPVLSSPNADQAATVGQGFSYDATQNGSTFTDPDGDALTYTIALSPGSNGLSSNAGQVTGTPQSVETTTVTITADDGRGGAVSDSFTITSTQPTSGNQIRNYIFGHSLINFTVPVQPVNSNEASVPHWMYLLAREAGQEYSVSGQYGFLREHANLPPIADWGFDIVPTAWDPDTTGASFADADFTTVLLTAGNFIQHRPSTSPYEGNNPSGTTPVLETLKIVDWLRQQEPGIDIYIYENWPDMGPYAASFPPTSQEFADYNAYVVGGFNTWWIDYHDAVMAARPDANVKMIPVGPVITTALSNSALQGIPVTELYEDGAPHGRPTIYFLASLVTYMSVYGVEAPGNFQVPSSIHPLVRDNYADIVRLMWSELQNFNDVNGNSRVFN